MTDKRPLTPPAIAVSPYLSLRQAVRPAIFAHALLTREKQLAGELAQECAKLIQLTLEAMEAAALVHLLSPATTDAASASEFDGSRTELIDAYAKAAASWTEVVGTAIALADALLDANRRDDVHRLADFLDAADEATAANDLRARAREAARRASEPKLRLIHPTMSAHEITAAIDALRQSGDEEAVSFYLRAVALAVVKAVGREEQFVPGWSSYYIYEWLARPGDVLPGNTTLFTCYYHGSGSINKISGPQFPAVVCKWLVQPREQIPASGAVASVIQIPEPLAVELAVARPTESNAFSRLDVLARTFWQLQADKSASALQVVRWSRQLITQRRTGRQALALSASSGVRTVSKPGRGAECVRKPANPMAEVQVRACERAVCKPAHLPARDQAL